MSRLVPINAATCPHCRGKKTQRVGYSVTRTASLWRCCVEDCGKIFSVPMLRLAKEG